MHRYFRKKRIYLPLTLICGFNVMATLSFNCHQMSTDRQFKCQMALYLFPASSLIPRFPAFIYWITACGLCYQFVQQVRFEFSLHGQLTEWQGSAGKCNVSGVFGVTPND